MWLSVKILPRHRLTEDAFEVSVQPRFGRIPFERGQFVVLELELASGIRRSAFSIVRSEGRGIILGIKKKGEDGISAHLSSLEGPVKASMAGPFGQFALNHSMNRHVFIAGGSGITPVRSMVDILLAQKRHTTLIYANQSPEQAMYLSSFRALAEEGHIELVEVYDRDIAGAVNEVDLSGAAIYICGPPGLMDAALTKLADQGIPDDRIRTERYGLAMGSSKETPLGFRWRNSWGRTRSIPAKEGLTMLEGATRREVRIPHACEVGVCGTCRAQVISGEVLCGHDIRKAGDEILTCISQPHGIQPPTVGPVKGGRAQLVTAFLLIATVLVGAWSYPPAVGFKAMGPMNTSHEDLECSACHKEAPGTFRQQVGHNARSLFGFHDADMVSVGMAPVDNAACLDCHDRPNDRHPVSRFMETRFAEQRAAFGPHECNNCHGEHRDQRVAMVNPGFCVNCHQETEVMYDTVEPSHAELIENGDWNTCLQCHDFHGNHLREVPSRLSEGIPQEQILKYLAGGSDPYGPDKTYTPRSE